MNVSHAALAARGHTSVYEKQAEVKYKNMLTPGHPQHVKETITESGLWVDKDGVPMIAYFANRTLVNRRQEERQKAKKAPRPDVLYENLPTVSGDHTPEDLANDNVRVEWDGLPVGCVWFVRHCMELNRPTANSSTPYPWCHAILPPLCFTTSS